MSNRLEYFFDDMYEEFTAAYVHHDGQRWPIRDDARIFRSRKEAESTIPALDARTLTGHNIVVGRTVAVTDWCNPSELVTDD